MSELVLIPLFIFFARICEVSLSTLRIKFTAKEFKIVSAIVGFLESLVWILAIRTLFDNNNSIWNLIAYASGFVIGNYVGMYIEKKIAFGLVGVRVMLKDEDILLVDKLSESGYGATVIDAQGIKGKTKIILSIVKRRDLKCVEDLIGKYAKNAFYTVEESRSVKNGVFPSRKLFHK